MKLVLLIKRILIKFVVRWTFYESDIRYSSDHNLENIYVYYSTLKMMGVALWSYKFNVDRRCMCSTPFNWSIKTVLIHLNLIWEETNVYRCLRSYVAEKIFDNIEKTEQWTKFFRLFYKENRDSLWKIQQLCPLKFFSRMLEMIQSIFMTSYLGTNPWYKIVQFIIKTMEMLLLSQILRYPVYINITAFFL